MKSIQKKASLKVTKDGRLFCNLHRNYKVVLAPRVNCKICWALFEAKQKQHTLDLLNDALRAKSGTH